MEHELHRDEEIDAPSVFHNAERDLPLEGTREDDGKTD